MTVLLGVWGRVAGAADPPTATQPPAPAVSMAGPRAAVTATAGTFRARGSEPGGSISEYYWTFGDGRSARKCST